MSNNDSWTPEEIARANERQREISEAAEQKKVLLELKQSKKTPIMYIFMRLLVSLIPFLITFLFTLPITSGFEALSDMLSIFVLLILSGLFFCCYLILWACGVSLVRSVLYLVGIVVLLFTRKAR